MATNMVTPADVRKFKSIYTKKFGVDLSTFDARTKLELLVRQMELVYQPITKKQPQGINENEKNNDKTHTTNSK